MYYLKDYWPGKIHASHEPYRVTEEEIIEVGRRWDPRPYQHGPRRRGRLDLRQRGGLLGAPVLHGLLAGASRG